MTPADPPTVFAIDDDAAVCASLQGRKHGLNGRGTGYQRTVIAHGNTVG
jgi:hypothetical protein